MPTLSNSFGKNNYSTEKEHQDGEQVNSTLEFTETKVCDLLGVRAVAKEKGFPVSLWNHIGLNLKLSSAPS